MNEPIVKTQSSAAQPLAAAGAIASSSLPIIGDIVNYQLQKKENKRAYDRNVQMWNNQNLYNHPSQQMARLKEAGLNPNLVYGNGALTVAGAGPDAIPAQANIKTGLDPMSKLGQFQNIQLTKAQTDNVQAETANKITENTNKTLQQEILRKEAERMGIDIDFLNAVNPDKALLVKQELLNKEVDTNTKTLDYQTKYNIQPYQITAAQEQAKQAQQETATKARQYNILGQDLQLGKERITAEKLANNIKRLDIGGKRTDNQIKQQNLMFETWKTKLAQEGVNTSDHFVIRALQELQEKYNLTFEQMYPNLHELITLINQNAGK